MNRTESAARSLRRSFWRFSAAFPLIASVVVLIDAPPVEAKSYKPPIAVMRPNGEVAILKGRRAKKLVKDALRLHCATCDSPEQAARLAEKVISKKHPPARYLITSRGQMKDHGWTQADWFYPSRGKHGPYLVSPLGIGDGSGAWDLWERATKRMERIIRHGGQAATTTSVRPRGGDSRYLRSRVSHL